jgi:tetratricopeptide (TPR) repeat protein
VERDHRYDSAVSLIDELAVARKSTGHSLRRYPDSESQRIKNPVSEFAPAILHLASTSSKFAVDIFVEAIRWLGNIGWVNNRINTIRTRYPSVKRFLDTSLKKRPSREQTIESIRQSWQVIKVHTAKMAAYTVRGTGVLIGTTRRRIRSIKITGTTALIALIIAIVTLGITIVTVRIVSLTDSIREGSLSEAITAVEKIRVFGDTRPYKALKQRGEQALEEGRVEEARDIIDALVSMEPASAYTYIMKAEMALQENDYEKAKHALQQAMEQGGGKQVVRAERDAILAAMESNMQRGEAPESLIEIILENLDAADSPKISEWLHDTHYWLRWNAVEILEKAGKQPDMVPVYMLDLHHGGSMRTRIRAARKLGEIGDRRAVSALKKARDKGFADPIVAATATGVLEERFNE